MCFFICTSKTIVIINNCIYTYHNVCISDCDYDRFVVAVGWDKRINVYVDSVDDLRQVQEPQPHWPDDIVNIVSLSIILNMFDSKL